MKVSIESLKKLTKINISTDELIPKIFTQIGAVENIEDLSKKYKGILIGEIIEKKEHTDSDKLAIYQVNIGKETVQVVAGDRSLEIGEKVAYFTPGSKVPFNAHPQKNDNVISKVTLRGVESNGMLASTRELDLGADHTKVLRLDKDVKVGDTFANAYGLNDLVLDIENKALANRADCFGLIGIAREVSAIQKLQFYPPDWFKNPKKDVPVSKEIKELNIQNNAQINCPRYMGAVLAEIELKDSPLWMQIELSKAGIKPINNVVDITNYVMLITSQPLHAFDYKKVIDRDPHSNGVAFITIRQAKNGEKILGINNKLMELDDTMAVVCDSENPILVAGVMGGSGTEIDGNTNTIILECANYNRYNSRKTSWKLGVFTEAVTRYTKAQDPNQCEIALYLAMNLLAEHANAKLSSKVVDIYPDPKLRKTIYIDCEKLCITTGLDLKTEEIKTILEGIEYEVEIENGQLKVIVPTFRQDVSIAEDIYEDIARIYGFNNILITLPTRNLLPPKSNNFVDLKHKIRTILASLGTNELLTYNFVGKELIENYGFNLENAYRLVNALSPDLEYMRISTLPSLLEKMKENIGRGYLKQAIFEINLGHNKLELDNENLPIERWVLSFAQCDNEAEESSSYFDAKIYLDQLEKQLHISNLSFELLNEIQTDILPVWISQRVPMYNPNRSAVVSILREGKKYFLGILGEFSNNVKAKNSLPNRISGFEIDLHEIELSINKNSNYKEPSRFPKIIQDLCFSLDANIPFASIKDEINVILEKSKLNYELKLLDIFSNKERSELKQITFRLSLQSREKTLGNDEYEKIKIIISESLNQKFKANLI